MNFCKKVVLGGFITLVAIMSLGQDIKASTYTEDLINHIHTYECNCNLDIKVKDINLREESLELGESYNGVAIVTLEVKNNNIMDLELSNIDIYPYQNEQLTKCFVTTASGDINGMVGYLKSNESKDVKIGVALNDLENPLELEFMSADENQEYKIREAIILQDKSKGF